ncbi:hypothetical protein BGZ67_009274 [Mortierella alpina]|nr:hypothetical protein BGZ67_009274 [Mortierella alpina]
MTNNLLTLFCLVEGEATSQAFSVDIDKAKTVDHLKELIKNKKTVDFEHVDANNLTLWRLAHPVIAANKHRTVLLNAIDSQTELDPADDISEVFEQQPPKKTIHIIVHPVHAPVPIRASTPLRGHLSDDSRPGTPLSGDLHVDIKKIMDKFFAPGPIANFLDAYVRGEGALPVTTGPIRGLPRAWRRGFGCGKTRAVTELLSQHWGFYFNASSDDWGSGDMITLHSTVQDHLKDTRKSFIVDRQANNAYARKTTLLLFLSRLLIFKYCLNVTGSGKTFTSAWWALLQVCPHVLFKDIFDILFLQVLKLRHHPANDLLDSIRNVYEDMKECLIRQGCLPNIKDDTRLLVVHDEAQFLGDEFNGSFQSMSSSDETPRPLLSPILHAFRNIGEHQLTLVTCGTGLSINTLFWVQSSGSGLKDSSSTFEYLEFPGWTDRDSMKTYISRVRDCLQDEQSKQALNEYLSQNALDMLYDKFVGRYRPAIVAMGRIVECNNPSAWKNTIEDAEERLVSWAYRHIKGNLCYEILRVHDKQSKYKELHLESIDNMLGLLMYQRCMCGNHDLVLKDVNPKLVEHAFGRIKIIKGHAVTVMDEPFVSLAVQNYFAAIHPYFAREVRKRMVKSSAIEQGCVFERFMMKAFSETFNTRPLSEWPHQPAISEMCPALVGKVEIVGWREPGLEQGTTHAMMSIEEFMKAHVDEGSIRNKMPVAPFFFPKSKPSGPDLLFFIRVDGRKAIPVFVQMKLHQGSSNFSEKDWSDALSTVSAPKIEDHAMEFRKYCPDNVYISMIVAYPTKWAEALLAPSKVPKDCSGVQQVVINVSDNNFGDIFPQEHMEFIDRLKNARKRTADNDNNGSSTECTKKSRS